MTVETIEVDGGYVQLIEAPVFEGFVLHTMYVEPGHRGAGLGRQLLDQVLALADAAGKVVALAPVPDRDCPIDVEAWYRRHGFRTTRSGAMMERWPPVMGEHGG